MALFERAQGEKLANEENAEGVATSSSVLADRRPLRWVYASV